MPTTPTPRNYDVTHIHQGPGDIWYIPTPPVDSTAPQLVLASDGSPDLTTQPGCICLGGTNGAITTVATPKLEEIKIDQSDGPVANYLTGLEMSIEADMAQLDPALLQYALPFAVYSTVVTPGYKQLTFGDQAIPSSGICIACISAKRAVSGKFIVSMLFAAVGSMPLSIAIGRAKASANKATFKGMNDLTRTAGRRMGVWYETI